MMKPGANDEQKRMIVAVGLAALLLIIWQIVFELPRREKMAVYYAAQQQQKQAELEAERVERAKTAPTEEDETTLTREQRLSKSARLPISSGNLHGSLKLQGLRLDDLTLARYKVTQAFDSPEVVLLSPPGDAHSYFLEIGWLSADGKTRVPDKTTPWKADAASLTPETPVNLSWDNGQGQRFIVSLSLDKNYMFSVRQSVQNHGNAEVKLSPFALINRAYTETGHHTYILHEGPLGVTEKGLKEISYEELRKEGEQRFEGVKGWAGITDKYWLTALVPDAAQTADVRYSYYKAREQDRYQADFQAPAQVIPAGGSADYSFRAFAGAKELDVLDAYAEGLDNQPPAPLFDRAVDLGVLYFLTKPLFMLLDALNTMVGNFGVAILLLTIMIKMAMFPLANKAYISSSQMRMLQPEMAKLKQRYPEDRLKFQQELMALYKREKVNPASGCLPMVIQIPVFFALYKVLFVTIEMRHAPFFSWIRDLSAADPSNIFTLFGLLPWTPPAMLHIGLLPILMSVSMAVQFKYQPTPTDPVQAKIFKFMPWVLLFVFAPMPAGLILYWTWSNILSIIQQQVITRGLELKKQAKQAAAR